jgi:outer membrane protein assembly factor BamD (BamD/ComL family)
LVVLGAALLGGCMSRSERLYQRAEMFFMQGQPELAAAEYHKLATKHPRAGLAPNALYKLAYLFREEFSNPQHAIQTYGLLGTRYPDSPYADEAWLWVLQIQGETLKDLEGMRRTRDLIREQFPQDERVLATAQLQYARALYAAGQLDLAESEARALAAAHPKQERSCAAALLIIARVLEKRGGKQSDAAVRAYEQIVSKYPDTPSAVEAKRAIGWLYYGKEGERLKAEQAAKQRASRMIEGVPGPPSVASRRLKPFACLASLLAHRGAQAAPEPLLIISGAAFDFWFEADRPDAPHLRMPRNALVVAAEQHGFSANVWSAPSAETSFASLAGAIAAGHPVMVPVSGGNWLIVTGYKAAEDRVYVLESGQGQPKAMSRGALVQRWASSAAGQVQCVTGPYYQLSMGESTPAPTATAGLAAAGRAAEARKATRASYEALVGYLSGAAGQADAAGLKGLRAWAERSLVDSVEERLAIAAFLRQAAQETGEGREALEQAAQGYEEAARLGQQLRQTLLSLTAPAQGAEPPPEQTWPEAAETARQMQRAEEGALQALAGVAR